MTAKERGEHEIRVGPSDSGRVCVYCGEGTSRKRPRSLVKVIEGYVHPKCRAHVVREAKKSAARLRTESGK